MGSGIHTAEVTVLILIVLVALLTVFAHRLKMPYPIVLVLGGLVLSFIPAVPHVSLSPTFVFLVVLPPLLFASALNTGWREFRYNLVSISMLGFGLVGLTVVSVAFVAHLFIPDFDWRVGAVLGAVLSTTDAIAVAAIARRVGMPHHLLQLIEGESLVNDASGLLAFQFTVALVASGEIPTLGHGVKEFGWLIVGGVAAGLLVAVVVNWSERAIHETALQLLVSVATPYFTYLLGEAIHSSGVLAVVACGLYLGRTRSASLTSEARLESRALWNTIDFAINSVIFIVVGLQLPTILEGMRQLPWTLLIGGAVFISAVVIGLRMFWIFPGAWFADFLRRSVFHQDVRPTTARELVVVGWSGLRGVLTLAVALSLPVVTDNGEPFPHRSTIIFFAFSVILATLVGQGLTLPPLLRWLGVCETEDDRDEERAALKVLLEAALKALKERPPVDDENEAQAADLLKRYYRQRLHGLSASDDDKGAVDLDRKYQDLYYELRLVERKKIMDLRQEGRFRESTLRDLEKDLDLADLRWRR